MPDNEQTWSATTPKPKPASNPDRDVQISGTIPASLKEQLKKRAKDEDRDLGVVVRRALQAYMKDWNPGQLEG